MNFVLEFPSFSEIRRGLGTFPADLSAEASAKVEIPATAKPNHRFRPSFPRNPLSPPSSKPSRQKQIPSSTSFAYFLLILTATVTALTSARAEVFHGTITVNQTAPSNAGTELELQPGSSPGVSLDNPLNPNFGDYFLDFPGNVGVNEGVLITSVAKTFTQNGNFVTSSAAHGLTGSGFDPNQFFVSLNTSEPTSTEGNGDAAFAFFSHDDWLCGTMVNGGINGGSATDLIASEGLDLGWEFVEFTAGHFGVFLRRHDPNATPDNGILLVNGAKNEDNYALSRRNTADPQAFAIFCHDNGVNGSVFEQDPVNFVYVSKDDIGKSGLTAMGRIQSDGDAQVSAGDFTIEKTAEGRWMLEIPGHSDVTGTLLVTPEGGEASNVDNIVTYQWLEFFRKWVIVSRDLPNHTTQDGAVDDEPMFNFAFFAAPITVTTLEDENDPNALATPEDISLREAISQNPGKVSIVFSPDLSGGTIALTDGEIDMGNITIDASDLPGGLTINAMENSRIFRLENKTATLIGLTLTGGKVTSSGGAISSKESNLTLERCTLIGNQAGVRGGAIYSFSDLGSTVFATLTMTDCALLNNFSAGSGGAIYNYMKGAAIATVTLNRCTLAYNSAATNSGAIANSADGIFLYIGKPRATANLILNHCTVAHNTAGERGGAIFNHSINAGVGDAATGASVVTINSSTLTRNSAANSGAIQNGLIRENPTVILRDSIVSGNTATNSDPNYGAGEGDLEEHGTNLIDVANIQLAPLHNYGGLTPTMPPLPGSPAIDMAGTTDPGGTDQRGLHRFVGNALDIGAVEIQATNTNIFSSVWDTDHDGDGAPFGIEFALGTDPLVSDTNASANLSIATNSTNQSVITFGHNPDANPHTHWVLTRSTDLINFDVILFSFDGTNETFGDDVSGDGLMNGVFEIIDEDTTGEEHYFYRLEAQQQP